MEYLIFISEKLQVSVNSSNKLPTTDVEHQPSEYLEKLPLETFEAIEKFEDDLANDQGNAERFVRILLSCSQISFILVYDFNCFVLHFNFRPDI